MYSVIFLLVSSMLASNDVGDYMINDILVQWLWWWKHQRGGNYSLEGLGAGVTPTPPPSIMEMPLSIHFLFIYTCIMYLHIYYFMFAGFGILWNGKFRFCAKSPLC